VREQDQTFMPATEYIYENRKSSVINRIPGFREPPIPSRLTQLVKRPFGNFLRVLFFRIFETFDDEVVMIIFSQDVHPSLEREKCL